MDSSIYEALVRLSQPWALRYPLIDFHGNMGSQAGDSAASMRYTECRLTKISEEGILKNLKKKNVDMILNYDDSQKEPITLPAIFPNLLCNPTEGIGVAMASSWLPHNLGEVAQVIFDYIDGIPPHFLAPDFPTGGIIINKNIIPEIVKTGKGTIKLRGRYKIEKNQIIFYEIPYGISTESILEQINDVCEKQLIEKITDIRDESNKKGLRLVIDCEKKSNLEEIVEKLFLKTDLQTSISYNQVALIDKVPYGLNLENCIKIYIEHNIDCLTRELNFDLIKMKERLHIVEGLLIALEDIDNVIKLIKESENTSKAKILLMEKYKLSEIQAKSILDMRLSSLAKLEKINLENERKELVSKIDEIEKILLSRELQLTIIKERLSNLVKKFGDERRTEISQIEIETQIKKNEIKEEKVVVTLYNSGKINKVLKSTFKPQKRKGKGVKNKIKEDDIYMSISTNTLEDLAVFTSLGKMYKIPVNNIPDKNEVKIEELIQLDLEKNEKVLTVVVFSSIKNENKYKYIVFFTKNGLIKKSLIEEYLGIKRASGIIAIKLKENDSIANVVLMNDEDVILVTKNGMGIHFETYQISPTGRNTSGVKAIKLNESENDEVLFGIPIEEEDKYISIFNEEGYARKVSIETCLPIQRRGGKGKIFCNDDNLISIVTTKEDDKILITGRYNSICIDESEIPLLDSSNSKGNIMMKDIITSVTKI